MASLAHFTDRKSQIAAFDSLWDTETPWIIVFSGMSGNGKSTLIDWLIEKRCRPQAIEVVKVDMSLFGGLNLPTLLNKLAVLFLPPAAQRFRAEYARASQIFNHNLAELIKAKAARPIDIDMIAEGGGQISQSSIRVQADEAGEDKLRQYFYTTLTAAFYTELANLRPQQIALFFDTFELAQDNTPAQEMGTFWTLLDELHGANPYLRVIVGGREDLVHQSARAWRCHDPLGVFSPDDSDAFLSRWSQDEMPAKLRRAIFELAQGHPLLTEMAAEVWRDGRAVGRPLTLDELKEGLAHRSGKEWLYGRIIERLDGLGHRSLPAAARYGPLLRSFNLRSLNAILPDGVEKLDDQTFERFIRYAFIKQAGAAWTFHELMRHTQRAYLAQKDDPEVEACHRRAVEFFQERAEATQEAWLARNALYHACYVDPSAVFDDWLAETFRAQLAGERGWWDELLTTLEAPAQSCRLSPQQRAQVIRNRGMWYVRNYNMEAALDSYQQALTLFRAVGSRLGEANTLKAIGDVHSFKKENEAALDSYQQALTLFRAVGSRLGEANTLKAIGDVHSFKKENEAALDSYQQALTLFRAVGDRLGEANTLQAIGDVQRFKDENEAALDSYQQALTLFRAVGDRLGEANTLKAIGDVQRFKDENEAALDSYQQALTLFRAVGDRLGEANTLKAIGDVQRFKDENEAALDSYQQALTLFRAVGDRLGEANTLKAIGDVHSFKKENEAALDSYQQALTLFRAVGDRLGEANTLQAIGDVQRFKDENEAALDSYQQALTLFRAVGDRLGEANTLQAIGDVQRFKDENEAALDSYQQALTLFRAVGDRLGEANTLKAIGDVHSFKKENEAALDSYQQALTLFRAVGDRLGEANTLKAIGDVQRFKDENEAALDSYQQALTLFRAVGDRLGEANTLQAIGDVHSFKKENEAALDSYQQALTLFRAVGDRLGEANTLQAIGDVQRFKDENEAALDSYQQALTLFRAVGDRLGEANTLQAIGDVQRFKDENEAALDSYQQALTLFRAVGDRLGEANTLKAIGFMKLDGGEDEAGLNAVNEALALYRQIGDRVGQVNSFWGLGIRLAQKGNLPEAEPLIAQTLEMVKQFLPDHPFTAQVETVLEQIRTALKEQGED